MACTIDDEVGGVDANSYCSIENGDAYHETHLYATDWEDAGDDDKCKALQMATRLLDSWFDWYGSVSSGTQRLLWPRINVTAPNGYPQASDEIPERIVQGTAELARQLIAGDRTADSETEVNGLTELTAGSVSMKFKSTASKPIPDAVMSLVSVFGTLKSRSGSGAVKVNRG